MGRSEMFTSEEFHVKIKLRPYGAQQAPYGFWRVLESYGN